MEKPFHRYQFRLINGYWTDVLGTGEILADVLMQWEIEMDCRTQFARLIDAERGLLFEIRAYTCAKIELTIHKMDFRRGN